MTYVVMYNEDFCDQAENLYYRHKDGELTDEQYRDELVTLTKQWMTGGQES